MAGRKNILYNITAAVVFVILETAAFAFLRHNDTIQGIWLSKGIQWVKGSLWGGSERVKYYFSLNKENQRLMEENARLSIELMKHAGMETDKQTAVVDTVGRFKYIPARIIKSSNNSQHNYLILGKGSEDGVRPLSGVVTSQGVVGIVDVVSPHYCYVMSFKNTDMEVSVRLGRDGTVGVLTWDGTSSKAATLNGIPQHIRFSPGDTVFTSGFSDRFPADIPLGLAGSSTIVNGAYYRIKVELFEDSADRRLATIVYNLDQDEIRKLEEGQ